MASTSSGVRKSVLSATPLVFLPCFFLLSCLGNSWSPIKAFDVSGSTESLIERLGENSAADTHSSATLKKKQFLFEKNFSLDSHPDTDSGGLRKVCKAVWELLRNLLLFALSDLGSQCGPFSLEVETSVKISGFVAPEDQMQAPAIFEQGDTNYHKARTVWDQELSVRDNSQIF